MKYLFIGKSAKGDWANPKLIYVKGVLFLFTGFLAAGLLLLEKPTLKVMRLLALTVWCFAHFYYFAFYVIEHYAHADF